MDITFCKQLMKTFSSSELEKMFEYSSAIWANESGEANFLLISAEDFMAEVCLSPPEHNNVEVVILPTNGRTEAQHITDRELILMLRDSRPELMPYIEV